MPRVVSKLAECKAKVQAIEAKLHQSKMEKEIQQFLKAGKAETRDDVFDYYLVIISLFSHYCNISTSFYSTK